MILGSELDTTVLASIATNMPSKRPDSGTSTCRRVGAPAAEAGASRV
jgi:hypothetical protein